MSNWNSSAQPLIVTGAAGFIGFHVVDRLLGAGHTVCGVDSLNSYYDPALKMARLKLLSDRGGFSFEQLDVSEPDRVLALFERLRPAAVVHLAAQAGVRHSLDRPRAYLKANVDGFLSILEACRHFPVEHLIYASSSSVYGSSARPPFSEDDQTDQPLSLYAATKRANELMAYTHAHLFGIPSTGLRFFTVYGPFGRPDMAYFKFTKAILEGNTIKVFNCGKLKRDFTYIDDVTEALVRLVRVPPAPDPRTEAADPNTTRNPVPHRILNIGNNVPIELERFIEVIEQATGHKAKKQLLPMQPGDVEATYADVSKLVALVGFAPRTPIETGIERFVSWYRSFYPAE